MVKFVEEFVKKKKKKKKKTSFLLLQRVREEEEVVKEFVRALWRLHQILLVEYHETRTECARTPLQLV